MTGTDDRSTRDEPMPAQKPAPTADKREVVDLTDMASPPCAMPPIEPLADTEHEQEHEDEEE